MGNNDLKERDFEASITFLCIGQKPRIQIALGGREADTIVFNNTFYQEIQNYVK